MGALSVALQNALLRARTAPAIWCANARIGAIIRVSGIFETPDLPISTTIY
jgi:hypothetical protein